MRSFGSVFLALLFGSAALPVHSQAASPQSLNLMPLPRSIQTGSGELVLNGQFHAVIDGSHDERLDDALTRFVLRLDRECGGIVRAQHDAAASTPATLTIRAAAPAKQVQSVDEDESYQISVAPNGATINAPNDLGAMHGLETLLQLVAVSGGACRLPAIAIADTPRFRWRGFMLDVSRHFQPVSVVERTLDGMAVAKLNVFHWHLSDDQGFRAESRKFPRFTEVASNGGLYYTQDQMREVVAYARARGIRVVPEFDMPGHSSTWLLAYPEIGAGEDIRALPTVFGIPQSELDPSSEKTYKSLDEFIGEMAGIFPDAYFHIGGDETKGKGWQDNPRIAEFMKKKGFKTPAELQTFFNERLLPILTKHDKRMMGWDEILTPNLPKDIVVQSWRGDASLAQGAQQGYTGVLSAPYYLNGQRTAAQVFLADPIPADTKLTPDQQKLILGGEICMWGEHINAETVDAEVWPRSLAIAERFWSPQSDRDVADMYRRIRVVTHELEDVGLTHISGPEKLRRGLVGPLASPGQLEALDLFASIIEPVSFEDRYHGQHTDQLTSLNRLIDAAVTDPPARQQIEVEVDALLDHSRAANSKAAEMDLRRRFLAWQAAAPSLEAMAVRSPRLNDIGPRAQQLDALAQMGLQSLAFLDAHSAPQAGWHDAQNLTLAAAEKTNGPQTGLVRFVFLPSMHKLIDAAAATPRPAP